MMRRHRATSNGAPVVYAAVCRHPGCAWLHVEPDELEARHAVTVHGLASGHRAVWVAVPAEPARRIAREARKAVGWY